MESEKCQEKDEAFIAFLFIKRTEARSTMIDSMSNEERRIQELMRSILPSPIFTKFCEAREITLHQMKIIVTDYEMAVKLTAENSGPQAITAKVTKRRP